MLEESQAHASHLATSHQAWVYEVQSGQYLGSGVNSAHTGGVVSLCEVGRRSQRVAVITKIFTLPTHRRHGYATRLLSEVMRL
jgi:predicted GNAT family acetyltransferase